MPSIHFNIECHKNNEKKIYCGIAFYTLPITKKFI